MSIDALFEPFTVRNLTLANRFVMSAMTYYKNHGGVPCDAFVEYHRARVAGGVGLSVTGGAAIDRTAANNHPSVANINPRTADAWRRVVDAAHDAGGPIAMQLWHAGGLFNVDPGWAPGPLESPSGLAAPGDVIGTPMTDDAIDGCIRAYGDAATLATSIGFDAIEIHGAHGFLIDQFFWNGTNTRDDRWGGPSIGERTAFATQVVKAVREAIGPERPLFMKVSQWKEQDYSAKLALSPAELIDWLGPLRDAGVDVFHCSQRRFWEPEFPGSDLNLAGWVKRELDVATVTIGSVGLSNDVMAFFGGEVAQRRPLDELVRRFDRGDFDLVGVARAVLADPDWVRTVRAGTAGRLAPIDAADLDLGL